MTPSFQTLARTMASIAFAATVAYADGSGAETASPPADLVLRDVTVFDVRDRVARGGRTVVVEDGRISAVLEAGANAPEARRTIDGRGRILTPGLVDVHSHVDYVLGDSISAGGGFIARLSMDPDSIAAYRSRFAEAYLPYGVTTVRDVGSDDRHLPMLVAWMKRSPDAPDFWPVGGALVSHEEGREPFPGHAVVTDAEHARREVRAYRDAGLRHVKLYWRLREPEFVAALEEARQLGMGVTGHIDFRVLGFERALDLGLRSFEHAYTIAVGALTEEQFLAAWREELPRVVGDEQRGRFYLGVMAYMHVLGRDNAEVEHLIERLAATNSTVVPTLHLFAQRLGLSPHVTPPFASFDDLTWLEADQRAWAVAGYRIMGEHVGMMWEAGIPLAVGTDWAEPGPAVLAEIALLHDAGIPMPDSLAIATLGGAAAIGLEGEIGVIEAGYRANLVLWEDDPLAAPSALFGGRTVIKDGIVWGGGA
jgi:imidazolonepropionase-like amidohydrolase